MADFVTNAKNLAELDLAIIEASALSGQEVGYQLGGTIHVSEEAGVEGAVVDTLTNRAAYLTAQRALDASWSLLTVWSKIRMAKPDALNDHSTHNLYPFEGKMMPQLARALINICSGPTPNVRLGDPFCGSGTVLLEGALLGHDVFGCDVDPFAVWLSIAKLSPTVDLLSDAIKKCQPGAIDSFESVLRDAFTKCHHTSNFSVKETTAEAFLSPALMFDVIVTSPPYYDAIDYVERHRPLRKHLKLEMDPKSMPIGTGQTVADYENSIRTVCFKMARSLRPGGKCALVIGDQKSVPTSVWYELYLKSAGLQIEYRLNRPYQVPTRGFQEDVILIARKPDA